MITMYLQNNRFIRKCSYIFTHPTDKYCLEQHWIIEQHLQKMKIPIDTNDIIWPIHLFFCDILLLSIIKYKSGNRPYLLSVFCVNWELQFQEVLFFVILDFFLTKHPAGSRPWSTDAEGVALTFALDAVIQRPVTPLWHSVSSVHVAPPVPSTCRPPLCRLEGHN